MLKVVALSDTHGMHWAVTDRIPEADVLVYAGDLSNQGSQRELTDFNEWLGRLPARHKIVVAGNHDQNLHELISTAQKKALSNAIYLQDDEVVIDGFKFYGSPWTPVFFDWYFMLPRGPEIRAKWDLIPDDTDVLITHGPPHGKLDYSYYQRMRDGCEDLRDAVKRVKPAYHVFGHFHGDYGETRDEHTTYLNVCTCNEQYKPTRKPAVFTLGAEREPWALESPALSGF